mmetsp:Transcript_41028/g.76291  ORF Transcript_41028/g.76291 Transcript_41028/m.76291 type:complete len:447 (-) Transcript_41028:59-1399(-)
MSRPAGSTIKLKAVFFLVLLAGHEAVRVVEETSTAKSLLTNSTHPTPQEWAEEYQAANQKCTWSMRTWKCMGADGGCERKALRLDKPLPFSEQCRLSDKYMLEHDAKRNFKMMAGVLKDKSEKYKSGCLSTWAFANLKCKRRMQQMVGALRFMSKAQGKLQFMTEEDRQEQAAVYSSTLEDLKGVLGTEATVAMKLKDKIQNSPSLKKDPEGTMKRIMTLLTKLTTGSAEEKKEAEEAIEKMPDSSPPLSPEEEQEAQAKAQELTSELQNQKNVDQALDNAALVETDDSADEEEGVEDPEVGASGSSALEVRRSAATMAAKTKLIIFVVLLVAIVAVSLWYTFLTAVVAYIFLSFFGCATYVWGERKGANGASNETSSSDDNTATGTSSSTAVAKKMGWATTAKNFGKCVVKVLIFPVKAVYQGVTWLMGEVTSTGGKGSTAGYER